MRSDQSDPDLLLDVLEPAASPPAGQQTIHERDLAALLGITRQAVGEKVRSGVLKRTGRATFAYPEAVRDYCAHLREVAGRAGRPAQGGDGVKAATERLRAAQAELAEAKAAAARGDLVEAAAVTRAWANLLRDLRNALLAVPSRCGAALPHLTATDLATLEREIHKALETLADAD